ncbi:hypothetical protein Poli38472_010427 [Pythium oligandrum]|uniref:RING-type E3 ubiquitin transferase n=1 Tax=Pythium oligandrum TaxID=41045 RepID=A0A8K1F9S9_PYTOL|nr:hypothetical protein Poli38472_010427 [Pythium oligandrum]|eukprot:TMW55545.1 hypothetical protein Poli38472_010427 [Pythium oligandrum]
MVKFWLYSSASLLACTALLWYTYMTRQQFYPAVIYLVTSKVSVLILGNAGLVVTILLGRLFKTIFLGSLRDAEVEILHENVRYAITETCLALTIFREELNFQVAVLFTSLIFLKVFHWLAQSRIEFIEQTDIVSRLTHIRLVALMTILAAVDTAFVVICGMKVMETGPSVFILFGFEFLIMLITLVAIFLRYVLYVIDTRMDNNWANKFTYLFYLELVSEILKLISYLVFFLLIFTYYGMPLHIVRDLWMSIKSLQRRIASYFRYRKITANLNERFPNPTEEELQDTDRTCIICREEMTSASCKKLPCSHIFHMDCLKMWVQRQQTCPTCRSTIPTGSRPPVVPQAPAAAAAAPVAAPVPAPAAPHAAPAPFQPQNNVPAAHAPPAPAAATPAAPGFPAAAPGAQPAGVPPAPFPHGYPPFMSPFMFGAPYGYPGFGGMPPFGFAQPPHPTGHPQQVPDAATIQRQLEQLHAQLAALQAMSQAYGMPAMPGIPTVPAASTTPHVASPVTAPPPSTAPASASAPVPAPAHPTPVPISATAVPSPVLAPPSATPTPAEGTTDLRASARAPTQATETEEKASEPVEMEIPRVMTEAERRREELRQRYSRIYGSSSTLGNANGDSEQESKTE